MQQSTKNERAQWGGMKKMMWERWGAWGGARFDRIHGDHVK